MAVMEREQNQQALLGLVNWYVESGVDLAIDDIAHDRYADCASELQKTVVVTPDAKQQTNAIASRPKRTLTQIVPPDDAIRAARESALSAANLDELARRFVNFVPAPFRDMAEHFLLHAGVESASLMAFESAPGETEERTGVAFSGSQARLLDNMLAAIGKSRESVRLAYVSPWRPPGDRPMTPHELAIFTPFAQRHVELAQPQILLLFGEAPVRAFLESTHSVSKLRGKWFDISCGAHSLRAMAFSSLDATLKSASLKPTAWRDLRAVARAFVGTPA